MSSILSTAVPMLDDDPAPCAVQLLVQVGDTHPELLRLVINHMQEGGAACLRMVNRALRLVVNRTVTIVACTVSRGSPPRVLDETFRNADHLRVTLPQFGTAAHDNAALHLSLFVEGMLRSSPGFLRKITALQILIATDLSPSRSKMVTGSLLYLVSRYAVRNPLLLCVVAAWPLCVSAWYRYMWLMHRAAVCWCRALIIGCDSCTLAHVIPVSLGIPTNACACTA
jgi:hypothetical protein